jgi:hypothetical protein
MHATPHLHPRRALLAAVAAFVLLMAALMPAALDDASFSFGTANNGASAQTPAPAAASTPRPEPAWQDNPFAYPLLQVSSR